MRQRGERASGIPLVAAFGHGLENSRLAAARIFTARVLTAGVFASRILAAGLFLRDGQINGVGALLERHVQEGGFGNRSGKLTVNSPVGG